MTERTETKIKEKLSEDSTFLSNPELKNTVVLEEDEYNINAVTAMVAEHTQADFTFNASLVDGVVMDKFDGSSDKVINYVPSDGGEFTGTVQISKNNYRVDSAEKDDIVNYGQIETAIKLLDGAPLYTWDAAKDYTAVKNAEGQNYKLNTVIGSVEDLPIFEAYSEGKAHSKFVSPDSYDNAYIAYSTATVREASFNPAYDNIKNTITKLVFNGDLNPNNKVKIKGTSFNNMRGLISVHLNNGVSELGDSAFSECASLSSIAIPESVDTIGTYAFLNCTALTGIVLGSKVTQIKTGTFKGCSNLKSIVICGKMTSIASDAFSGCDNLTKIYYSGTQAEWDAISNNPIKSSVNRTVIPIDGTGFPFLYICKDPDIIDTSLTSNKMFLKLPNKPLVEISKGAARLERRDSKTTGNVDYFTYDVLAAVIAGINSRITALGSKALALPETLKVYDSETTAVVKIPTKIANESISTDSDKALLVEETAVPSVQVLDQAIKTLENDLPTVIANETTYTNTDPILNKIGGIEVGTTFENVSIKDLITNLLYPYTAPTTTNFIITTGAGVREKGTNVNITEAKITVTKKTNKVISVGLYKDDTLLAEEEINLTSGSSTVTLTSSDNVTDNKTIEAIDKLDGTADATYKIKVYDGKQYTDSTSKTFTFVYPYYYGVIASTAAINATTVSGLTKDIKVKSNSSYLYTTDNQKPVFAYPSSYGELKSITDAALPYTWDRSTITINGVSYYAYVGSASTMTNTYNFKII